MVECRSRKVESRRLRVQCRLREVESRETEYGVGRDPAASGVNRWARRIGGYDQL